MNYLDPFELHRKGLEVGYVFVSERTGMRWVEATPPMKYRAAAYREVTKQIRNGRPMPFAIPVVWKAPKILTRTCCR